MNKIVNTEIIAVGTELLLGQIANTNAQWMSEQLTINGVNTFYHTVVGDNMERLTAVFAQAQARSSIVIVTGGLGPTDDDLSREAFQCLSNIPIIEEKNALDNIKQFYENRQLSMTPNNKRQARVFKDSTVLDNKFGMAPGNIVTYKNVKWIFLPGVPREMKQLFSDEVIPFLKDLNGEMVMQSTVLRFTGIGESALEDKLQTMIREQQNPTIAPLSEKDGVTIRLTAKAQKLEQAQKMLDETQKAILQEVGDYFYGTDNENLQEKVFKLLQKHNKQLSAAESLTGGLFADKLVGIDGASTIFNGGVVCYNETVKENILHVRAETIEKHGTVSGQCARELAKNVCTLLDSSIGISFTGVAGPTEVEGKKVGTVYIGLYDQDGYEHVEKCHFHGGRQQIRYSAVLKGYELLFKYLK